MNELGVDLDSTREAQEILDVRWRAMTPTEKFRVAAQLTSMATTLARTGIRRLHPDLSDEDLRFQLASRRYGHSLAEEAFGPSNAVG